MTLLLLPRLYHHYIFEGALVNKILLERTPTSGNPLEEDDSGSSYQTIVDTRIHTMVSKCKYIFIAYHKNPTQMRILVKKVLDDAYLDVEVYIIGKINELLTLFDLGFLRLLRPGGIFSSPLPIFRSSNAKSFKFCRKKYFMRKFQKQISI